MKQGKAKTWLRQFTGFDYFVLAGAAVNVAVVFYLTGYWIFFA